MGELAVGPVHRAPGLDQVQDRLLFGGQDPMQRVPAGTLVDECPSEASEPPTSEPALVDPQQAGGPFGRPARRHGVVDQAQQGGLGIGVDPAYRLVQAQAERCFPRTSDNSIASSLIASDNRAFSAWSASTS